MRIAAGIEYDGAAFNGWQIQPRGRSVQEVVERALAAVADQPLGVVCAGRTDAGVHAIEQIVHFDVDKLRPPHAWTFGANSQLPRDVNLLWAIPVAGHFHARFSAIARTYRYWILNRRTRTSLGRDRLAWIRQPLDAERMQAAASLLLGEHDFSAFRAAACQSRTPMRRVTRLQVSRHEDLVALEITANAFLHHMVRNIVGVLLAVGRGEARPEWVAEVLAGRDRRDAGVTAPPQGLYLHRVSYPGEFDLPQSATEALTPPV